MNGEIKLRSPLAGPVSNPLARPKMWSTVQIH